MSAGAFLGGGEMRKAINAFRGFAALYVAVYHLRYFTHFDWFGHFPVLRFGYIGVDFFFILSGLIISHVYLARAKHGDLRFWGKFIWFRIARLFPVHLLIMLAMLGAACAAPMITADAQLPDQKSLLDWLSLTLLVRQWFLPDGYVWNSPAWSVSAEFFAYLVLFPLIAQLVRAWPRSLARMILLAAGVSMYMVLWASGGTLNLINGAGPMIRITAGFASGCGLFLLLSGVRQAPLHDRLLVGLLVLLPLAMVNPVSLFAVTRPVIELAVLASISSLVCLAYLADGRGSRWLAQRPLFYFGEISFALYMCHVPVMTLCRWAADLAGIERGFGFGVLLVAASLAVAELLHRRVEIPSRAAMRRWYERSQSAGGVLKTA